MTGNNLEVIEIYPHILVYKNLFKDISKSCEVLKDSLSETEDRLFSPWTQWSFFGEYLNPIIPNFFMSAMSDKYGNLKDIKTSTEIEENQKNFAIEMMDNFHLATEDYIKRYNIDVDLNEVSIDESGNPISTWRWTGGTIGKYHITNDDQKLQ